MEVVEDRAAPEVLLDRLPGGLPYRFEERVAGRHPLHRRVLLEDRPVEGDPAVLARQAPEARLQG